MCVNILAYNVFLTMCVFVLLIYSDQPYIDDDRKLSIIKQTPSFVQGKPTHGHKDNRAYNVHV